MYKILPFVLLDYICAPSGQAHALIQLLQPHIKHTAKRTNYTTTGETE